MAVAPDTVREGYIDFEVKSISRPCQTYYKIFGDFKPGVRPIGCEYLEIMVDITRLGGRPSPLIIYDQIGNGRSTHLPDKKGDEEFWSFQLFIDEFTNLTTKLLKTVPVTKKGRNDEATDSAVAPFVERIKGAKWVKFKNSSHMAHFEVREEFMRTISAFLYD